MALTCPLADLRRELQTILTEDLAAALTALKDLLPEQTDGHTQVLTLQARLKDANKEKIRNTLSPDEYQRRVDTIRAECFDLIAGLEEADFSPAIASAKASEAGKANKQGSVLYRVPHQMPIRKPSICLVRVALDADALLDDLVLDDDVRLRERVQVSDMMRADLLDPENDVFHIRPLSTEEQLVREDGYTQWLFSVTPRVEGEHQLLVKVSMLEYNPHLGRYVPREVSILETVTIVTEGTLPVQVEEPPLKSTGERFALADAPASSYPLPAKGGANKGLRALALFLAFLVAGTGATYAFTPPDTLDWWQTRYLENTPQAYQEFIQTHPASPHRPRAIKVLKRLETKHLEILRAHPTPLNVRQFLVDFPVSERLAEVKRVVDSHAELQAELPALETAYVEAVRQNPSPVTVRQFLVDFPRSERLAEVVQMAAAQSTLLAEVQPELEQALVEKVKNAGTAAEVQALLPALESAGSDAGVAQVEKALATKPFRKEVQAQLQETRQRVQQREASSQPTQNSTMSPDEARDWSAAEVANTARAYVEFANKYPRSAQFSLARTRINALKPALSPQEQDWKDATLAHTPEAYIYFAQKYPNSTHFAEARDRIRTFSLSVLERKRLDEQAAERLRREQEDAARASLVSEIRDADADGVPDKDDNCPQEKGAAKDQGCPPPENVSTDLAAILTKIDDNMVSVPGGTFTMGCQEGRDKDCASDEKPAHSVTLSAFRISRYEVTQRQWEAVMGENPSNFKGCSDCPVEQVSWEDVQKFLTKLNKLNDKNYRLPTEAEWEYAARGGSKSQDFAYGGGNSLDAVAWYNNNSGSKTHPVGRKKANELGLYDMSGNVYEWCADWHSDYPAAAQTNPKGAKQGGNRVSRGGGWFNDAGNCRPAHRRNNSPTYRGINVGFRLARSF